MQRIQVTRKRIAQVLTNDDLRQVMRGDFQHTLMAMCKFVQADGEYVGRLLGRIYLGGLTMRQFLQATEQFKNDLAVTPKERQLLQVAFEKGTATAPKWIRILDAAKDWGQLPWVIAEDDQKQLWFRRYSIVEGIRAKALNKRSK